ncbi:hypothetical protein GCM10027300_04910 [Modestobacter lapidis]
MSRERLTVASSFLLSDATRRSRLSIGISRGWGGEDDRAYRRSGAAAAAGRELEQDLDGGDLRM